METIITKTCQPLYHGTSLDGLKGETVSLAHNNTGIGFNMFTLGNAFYTTPQLEAAKLFSHIAEQNRNLMNEDIGPLQRIDAANDALLGKVYFIVLYEANILDASKAMDRTPAFDLLDMAGVPANIRNLYQRRDQMGIDLVADIIRRFARQDSNSYEYLCRALGYDGISIREEAWMNWQYYPSHIGVNWNRCADWPPTTVAIYDTGKIKSFTEHHLEHPQPKIIQVTKPNKLSKKEKALGK